GVQTCALPIYWHRRTPPPDKRPDRRRTQNDSSGAGRHSRRSTMIAQRPVAHRFVAARRPLQSRLGGQSQRCRGRCTLFASLLAAHERPEIRNPPTTATARVLAQARVLAASLLYMVRMSRSLPSAEVLTDCSSSNSIGWVDVDFQYAS